MNKAAILKFFGLLGLMSLVLYLILALFGWMARPDMDRELRTYSKEEIAEVEELRRVNLTPDNPPVIYREVDYAQGESAAWYPKKESPILSELVQEGVLPPVHERVGAEVAVVQRALEAALPGVRAVAPP